MSRFKTLTWFNENLKKMKTDYLQSFNIAGFSYYDGALVFSKLKIGKKLRFKHEKNNKYDRHAVAIYLGKNKLGFIPRTENRVFSKLLKVGLGKSIRVLIQRIQPNENPENQIQVVVHLIN